MSRSVAFLVCLAWVVWMSLLVIIGTTNHSNELKPSNRERFQRYEGVIKHPVYAIGGETTGTVLKTKDGCFELDVGENAKLRETVIELNGKSVIVEGTICSSRCLEGNSVRHIISVHSINEVRH